MSTFEISAITQWTDIFEWPMQDITKSCMGEKSIQSVS